MTIKNLSNILRMNQRALTELFEDYFNFSVPSALAKKLFETKYKKENNELVELMRVRWSNLKDKIGNMSKKKQKMKNQIKY